MAKAIEATEKGNAKNLIQKLIEVRKSVPYLQKSQQGHNYKYVSSAAVVGVLRDKLDEFGLMLFPKIISSKVTPQSVENKDKYNNVKVTTTFFTELELEFEWVDAETGESKVIPFYAQGIDIAGEKGVGKALTYAEKYFLLKQFSIPTDQDDPDSFNNKVDSSQANIISGEQAEELKGYVNILASNRRIPVDGLLSSMGIRSLDKLTSDLYFPLRNDLIQQLNEFDNAQKVQQPVQQPVQNQIQEPMQNQQQPVQQPVQQQQPVQEPVQQQHQQPVQADTQQQANGSFMINRIEKGMSPSQVEFAKLFVTPEGTQEEVQILANTPDTFQMANTIAEGTMRSLILRTENNWNFLVGIGA